MRSALWLWPSLALCLACSSEKLSEGLDEPIQVHRAQFVRGELPGSAPSDEPREPHPTSAAALGRIIEQGSDSFNLAGRASPTTEAIAVALRGGGGSGYWVFPVGTPDPQFNQEPAWAFSSALSPELVGLQHLRIAAVDAQGDSGSQSDVEFCVAPRIPDNLNACIPTRVPPRLVVSLSWDTDVDLDLVVVTPDGKVVSPKDPSTALPDEDGEVAIDESTGLLDLDSNAACRLDHRRLENLVFSEAPAAGKYEVYVSLFDPCGENSTRFTISYSTRQDGDEEGTFTVAHEQKAAGVLNSVQADAGKKLGTYITKFQVK